MKNVKTKTTNEVSVVLALYPHSKGLAYAVMDNPSRVIESKVRFFLKCSDDKRLQGIQNLLSYYHPDVVILKDESDPINHRQKRTRELIMTIEHEARTRNLSIAKYSREQIREAFDQFGAKTKYEICSKIAEWLPEYEPKVPRERQVWGSESPAMSEFDSLSLAYTHYYLK